MNWLFSYVSQRALAHFRVFLAGLGFQDTLKFDNQVGIENGVYFLTFIIKLILIENDDNFCTNVRTAQVEEVLLFLKSDFLVPLSSPA